MHQWEEQVMATLPLLQALKFSMDLVLLEMEHTQRMNG
jgi:hypothetical protein